MKKTLIKIGLLLVLTGIIYYVEGQILRDDYKTMETVVVLKGPLAADVLIHEDMVRFEKMPGQYIFKTYSSKQDVVGKLTTKGLERGHILGPGDFKAAKDVYSHQPKSGTNRLITKRFGKDSANSFLLEPGQVIDLVYVPNKGEDQGYQKIKDVIVDSIYDENFELIGPSFDYATTDSLYVCFEVKAPVDEFLKVNDQRGQVKISIKRKE